jgi:hypothetical protein
MCERRRIRLGSRAIFLRFRVVLPAVLAHFGQTTGMNALAMPVHLLGIGTHIRLRLRVRLTAQLTGPVLPKPFAYARAGAVGQ